MHVHADTAWIALGVWFFLVLVHGFWRSRGPGSPDPIRPSGPLDQM